MFCRRSLFVVCGTVALALGGCGAPSAPRPSDAALGRELLQNALDAWKKGDTMDSYRRATPGVTVVDPQWAAGTALLSFELAAESTPDGYDVQFKVKLVQKDTAGKSSSQKAVYNVSTTPGRAIVRIME